MRNRGSEGLNTGPPRPSASSCLLLFMAQVQPEPFLAGVQGLPPGAEMALFQERIVVEDPRSWRHSCS